MDDLRGDWQSEEDFHDAADYVQHWAARGVFETEVLLQLYALYKQAVDGPCCLSRPYIWQRQALAKWRVWHELGHMSKPDAQRGYVALVSASQPQWQQWKLESGGGGAGAAGPVFSKPVQQQTGNGALETTSQAGSVELHNLASEGDAAGIQKLMKEKVDLHEKDVEGRTALHWAADRGHVEVVDILLKAGLDPDLQDSEGQSPLHYAALCEHEKVAEVLLEHGAKRDLVDESGDTPEGLAPKEWTFLGTNN